MFLNNGFLLVQYWLLLRNYLEYILMLEGFVNLAPDHKMGIHLGSRGPFIESPGNLSGPISVFGDKCFLTEVNFC